jgi:methylated-DNA-[protein]-cysteine S-methyltransferase
MGEKRTLFTVETSLGFIAITASNKRLLFLALPTLQLSGPRPNPPPEFAEIVDRVKAYCNGTRISFSNCDLDLGDATPFQAIIWEITRSIPYGETRSYRWVAEQTCKPEAVRAVGQALGKNPLPIIIPCHRVIASDGGLGGYNGGLEMKRCLLQLEFASFTTNAQLNK